jgi:origin recognition complex subunit 1
LSISRACFRQVTVLMVDELDLLVTRNQSVLYNLFDWPTRKNSRLVVVGIANTMDLPERLLPRINSRLGLHRVNFQPYTQQQLQQIIKARLSGLAAFKDKAVELASRKVAAVSGDVRRALELCRRAAEIAEAEQATTAAAAAVAPVDGDGGDEATQPPEQQLVQMEHITAAVKELFGEPHMVALRTAGPHAKVALCALLCEMRRTGLADVAMEDVYVRYAELCRMHGVVAAAWGAAAAAVGRLGEARVLLCEPGALGAAQRVALNVSVDSVEYTLKVQSPELPWLATFMQRLITAS